MQKNGAFMALGGLVVVGLAVATLKLFSSRREGRGPQAEVVEPTMKQLLESEGLFPVKLTENKYCLHPEYLIELSNFIGVLASRRMPLIWEELKARRRTQFQQQDWEAYFVTVREEFRHSNRMHEQVSMQVR